MRTSYERCLLCLELLHCSSQLPHMDSPYLGQELTSAQHSAACITILWTISLGISTHKENTS